MPPLRWIPTLVLMFVIAAALAAADDLFGHWLSNADQRYASGVLAGLVVWGAAMGMGRWLPWLMRDEVRSGPEFDAAKASLARVAPGETRVGFRIYRSARLAASTVSSATRYCIILSDSMVREMSPSALDGVMAHELGHVAHRHPNKTSALLAILCAYKLAVGVPAVAAVAGLLGYLALMRHWEFAADAAAGQRIGVQTVVGALAEYRERAEVGQESPWSEWFSGHPATRRRLARLLT